jgi:hypothetical protein
LYLKLFSLELSNISSDYSSVIAVGFIGVSYDENGPSAFDDF